MLCEMLTEWPGVKQGHVGLIEAGVIDPIFNIEVLMMRFVTGN